VRAPACGAAGPRATPPTRVDSLDAIRAFAGDAYETPVLEPQALALLSHHDERAQHFETSTFAA
jgi:hypothetical protein